jgi:hypothetical protein
VDEMETRTIGSRGAEAKKTFRTRTTAKGKLKNSKESIM